MGTLPVNPDCALSGTRCCKLLNMQDCTRCTVRNEEDKDAVRADVALYETLLPEGGVARLFTSKECAFCKGEEKGARSGFAILDMAHPEPRRIQKWLLGKKRVSAVGTMIPVQMPVCTACRRRFLLMDYLPTVVPVLFGAVGLVALFSGDLSATLGNLAPVAPFLAWLLLVGAGVLAGKAAAKGLKKRSERTMITDVLTHPAIRAMLDKGWEPLVKSRGTKLLFSKSCIARGLGTAEDDGPEETEAEAAEAPEPRETPETAEKN